MESNATAGHRPQSINCQADQFFRQINIEFLIHELKDPLSIIETTISMLLEKRDISGPLTSRQEKSLLRVQRSSRNLRAMVYELLEVGRAESVCFIRSSFDPQAVLYDVLLDVIEARDAGLFEQLTGLTNGSAATAVLAEKKVYFDVDADAGGLELVHDKTKFSQIIANLLKNAFTYRREAVHIILRWQNAQVEVSVGDDGPGIDPIHQQVVFERYKQVAPKELERRGHGLGLAMARILARSMGGDITVQSKVGQGATFQLQLPLVAP